MLDLHEIYRPITAVPFISDDGYREQNPAPALRPYIRCFWGTRRPSPPSDRLVIPDTCMDLIFRLDGSNSAMSCSFCGIDDTSHLSNTDFGSSPSSTFAIRFYAWSAVLFAQESMAGVKNRAFDGERHFFQLKRELEPLLWSAGTFEARIALAEACLLKHIRPGRANPIVMEAVGELLSHCGTLRTTELAQMVHVSPRQLERLFYSAMGISPKSLSSLVRYQYLWRNVLLRPDFQVLDAVEALGYTDQSHLLRDFKRFHTLSIPEARALAWKDVAFLQASSPASPVK